MTATSTPKESDNNKNASRDKEDTKALAKKGIFMKTSAIPEEEQEPLNAVVSSTPITIVPSMSRITTQSSLLNQRTWDGKK